MGRARQRFAKKGDRSSRRALLQGAQSQEVERVRLPSVALENTSTQRFRLREAALLEKADRSSKQLVRRFGARASADAGHDCGKTQKRASLGCGCDDSMETNMTIV
jgi:hypothetical protein